MSEAAWAPAHAGPVRSCSARKDGRTVLALELAADGTTVVAQVFTKSSDVPVAPGPYRFATTSEAIAFVDEAVETLVYLGCEIS